MHAAQWPSSLEAYAYPTLARMSVSDIETAHVMQVLKPIWKEKCKPLQKYAGALKPSLVGNGKWLSQYDSVDDDRIPLAGADTSTSCWLRPKR